MTQPLLALNHSRRAHERAVARRILLVDEHAPSRVVIRHVLELRGHHCEVVATASTALAAVDTFRPDLVLLEWHFRNGTGLGLAAALRGRSLAQGRPLVIVVVSTQIEPIGFRERESIDAYVTKPMSLDDDIEPLFTRLLPH